jgi:hypothetical protein
MVGISAIVIYDELDFLCSYDGRLDPAAMCCHGGLVEGPDGRKLINVRGW